VALKYGPSSELRYNNDKPTIQITKGRHWVGILFEVTANEIHAIANIDNNAKVLILYKLIKQIPKIDNKNIRNDSNKVIIVFLSFSK